MTCLYEMRYELVDGWIFLEQSWRFIGIQMDNYNKGNTMLQNTIVINIWSYTK